MKPIQFLVGTAMIVSIFAAASAAFAADEYNVSTGTTVDGHGVGVRGSDVVALSTGLDVTPGYAKFTQVHDGVAYYFLSEETQERFAADPERYIPQYGGFCALGVALGKKLDGSPAVRGYRRRQALPLPERRRLREVQGGQGRNPREGGKELAGDAPCPGRTGEQLRHGLTHRSNTENGCQECSWQPFLIRSRCDPAYALQAASRMAR